MVFLIGPIPSENRVGYERPFYNVVQLPFTGKMKTKGDNPCGQLLTSRKILKQMLFDQLSGITNLTNSFILYPYLGV